MNMEKRKKLKSSDLGKTFKFTKEFEFDFDLNGIPDDIYKCMVEDVVDDLTVTLHSDGEISISTDWTIGNSRRIKFVHLVHDLLDGSDDEEMAEIEDVLKKAITVIQEKRKR